ncbi:MAG: hypothetical protein KDD19_11000 [Phaeodactylibacter sp.]|nr:hypothetical protein [Phaeodactylibacter sp.]MCB9053883.1 hypothetical protein [Lewinellaceae bacterium]
MRSFLILLIGMAAAIPHTSVASVYIPHPEEERQEIHRPGPERPFIRARIRHHYRKLRYYSRKLIRLAIILGVGFVPVWWALRRISEVGGLPGWVAFALGLWVTLFALVVAILIVMWITWPFRLLFWWISGWGWKRRFARCSRF